MTRLMSRLSLASTSATSRTRARRWCSAAWSVARGRGRRRARRSPTSSITCSPCSICCGPRRRSRWSVACYFVLSGVKSGPNGGKQLSYKRSIFSSEQMRSVAPSIREQQDVINLCLTKGLGTRVSYIFIALV